MTRHDHDLATRTAHQGYASAMGARIFLGHGASGTAASMAPFVDGLRRRGFDATAIDLPKRKAEDAVPAFHAGGAVRARRRRRAGTRTAAGSPASPLPSPSSPYAALVLFSYPLHPPGAPERTDARIAHWPAIACPVLLLSGESDPFARIDLLRAKVAAPARRGAGDLSPPGPRSQARARGRPGPCGGLPGNEGPGLGALPGGPSGAVGWGSPQAPIRSDRVPPQGRRRSAHTCGPQAMHSAPARADARRAPPRRPGRKELHCRSRVDASGRSPSPCWPRSSCSPRSPRSRPSRRIRPVSPGS